MECNCKWTETILGIVILVFALWGGMYADWVIIISAVLLLIHAWKCKNCGTCMPEEQSKPMRSSRRKKRR